MKQYDLHKKIKALIIHSKDNTKELIDNLRTFISSLPESYFYAKKNIMVKIIEYECMKNNIYERIDVLYEKGGEDLLSPFEKKNADLKESEEVLGKKVLVNYTYYDYSLESFINNITL